MIFTEPRYKTSVAVLKHLSSDKVSTLFQNMENMFCSSMALFIALGHVSKSQLHLEGKNGHKRTHICRIKGCGGAGWPPPPIIFERLKLPQQIIYRRKENLSESPNHQKYRENILVSRFYEQFSRNRRNLGHFRKFEKISNS